jgi:hypothetical protein
MRSVLSSTAVVCPPILRLATIARDLFVRCLLGEPLQSQSHRFVARGLFGRFVLSFRARCFGERRFLETGFGPPSMMLL